MTAVITELSFVLICVIIIWRIEHKCNYYPAKNMVMNFMLGNYSRASIDLIELLILTFSVLFATKYTLILVLKVLAEVLA